MIPCYYCLKSQQHTPSLLWVLWQRVEKSWVNPNTFPKLTIINQPSAKIDGFKVASKFLKCQRHRNSQTRPGWPWNTTAANSHGVFQIHNPMLSFFLKKLDNSLKSHELIIQFKHIFQFPEFETKKRPMTPQFQTLRMQFSTGLPWRKWISVPVLGTQIQRQLHSGVLQILLQDNRCWLASSLVDWDLSAMGR